MKKMHRGFFEELSGFKRGIDHVIAQSPKVIVGGKNEAEAKSAAEVKRLRKMAKRAKEVKS